VPTLPAVERVSVGYVPVLTFMPLYLAVERGYFAEQRIEVELERIQSGADVVALLANGQLDTAVGAVAASAFNAFDRGVVFDSAGRVERTFRMPLESLHEARPLDDTLMLLAGPLPGRDASPERARLHVWNLADGKVIRSFFQPYVRGRAHSRAANISGLVSMDLHGDTIAATFAISDTVYFFDLNGRTLRKVPIPFRHFRPVSERRRLPRLDGDIVAVREWAGTFSFITRVFWLRDGTLLVQYQDRKGLEPHWRLLGMSGEGAPLFEAVETPRLLQVNPATGVLYFQKPGSLTPNVWTEATLRR